MIWKDEVSTTCVSGWVKHFITGLGIFGPPAHAGDTDFISFMQLFVPSGHLLVRTGKLTENGVADSVNPFITDGLCPALANLEGY